jgi:gluconokinase
MAPSATPSVLLSLDVGTSSTRVVIYDAATGDQRAELPIASVGHAPEVTPDGGATLDADTLVEEAVTCLAEALASLPEGTPVAGVAGCTFWHSFLGVGADGAARTPVFVWSDRRSADQVERLRHATDAGAYSQRTGCPLHTSYALGKLLWLRETDPQTFDACVRFVSPAEYLFGRLFGADRVTVSRSMASGTGLLDQTRGVWDPATLALVPGLTAARLSPVGDAPVSGLAAPYRDRLAALADVPFFPPLGDGACSNLGVGATGPGRIALMIGTSGAMRVVLPTAPGQRLPTLPHGLWRYQADAGRALLGGALSNGGNVWAFLTRTVQLPQVPAADLDRAIGSLPPDGHGLTVLPFLSGERAPLWRDDMTAAIVGLTQATTPVEIARAHLEAVAYRFAAIRERLRDAVPQAAEVIGTGNGLENSPAWAQIICDVLGEPITVSGEEEGSSRGAALWAREKLGLGRLEDAPYRTGPRYTPDPSNAAAYAAARARHEELLGKLL